MSEQAINYREQIKYLTQLQKVDQELRKLVERQGSLPLIINELKEDIERIESKKVAIEQRISDYQKAITVQKDKAEEARKREQQYEKKSKDSKSKQELDLIMEDIELQKIEALLCEKKIKEHQNTIIVDKNKIELLNSEIEEKRLSVDEKERLLKKIDEENQQQKEPLEKKRQTITRHILIDTYGLYEQISNKYKNAVVDILNQACEGCNILVPLQRQVEIEERKKIHACPHCSRILAYVKNQEQKKKPRRRITKSAATKKAS